MPKCLKSTISDIYKITVNGLFLELPASHAFFVDATKDLFSCRLISNAHCSFMLHKMFIDNVYFITLCESH